MPILCSPPAALADLPNVVTVNITSGCADDAADLAGQEQDIRDPAFRARVGVPPR